MPAKDRGLSRASLFRTAEEYLEVHLQTELELARIAGCTGSAGRPRTNQNRATRNTSRSPELIVNRTRQELCVIEDVE